MRYLPGIATAVVLVSSGCTSMPITATYGHVESDIPGLAPLIARLSMSANQALVQQTTNGGVGYHFRASDRTYLVDTGWENCDRWGEHCVAVREPRRTQRIEWAMQAIPKPRR